MTHWNNPISTDFSTLSSATLQTTLQLTKLEPPPPGSAQDVVTLDFAFKFFETPNVGGDVDDVFALDLGNIPNLDSIAFQYEGLDYLLSIAIFNPLNLAETPLVPLGALCLRSGYKLAC